MEKLKSSLRKTIEKNQKSQIQVKSDDEYFLEEFQKVNLKGEKTEQDSNILPKFYSGLPAENDELVRFFNIFSNLFPFCIVSNFFSDIFGNFVFFGIS